MPETSVDRSLAAATGSASAAHLNCSRIYIGKLEADGVIQRQSNGFPLDQRRVAYVRYLRRERGQSARSEADADHVLQLRLMEKKHELVRRADGRGTTAERVSGKGSTRSAGKPRTGGRREHRTVC